MTCGVEVPNSYGRLFITCSECKRLEYQLKKQESMSPTGSSTAKPNAWQKFGALTIWISVFWCTYILYKLGEGFEYKELLFSTVAIIAAYIISKLASKLVGVFMKYLVIIAILVFAIYIVATLMKTS